MSGNWNDLTPQEKADEFDASFENPTEYVAEEFPNGAPPPAVIVPDHVIERLQYPNSAN
jgi:hypothetical protein